MAKTLIENQKITMMTSQASKFIRVTKIAEIILTALYVFLIIPQLSISKESLNLIVHVMGIIRVNSFSLTSNGETIATGLFWPANLINHACVLP